MINGFRVLDADAHVVEPAHVFSEWSTSGTSAIEFAPDTPMVPCGDFDLLTDQFENGFDAPSYLRAMDAQGIDAVVLYPSIGLFVPFQPSLSASQSADACRSYNDWISSYCAVSPERMVGTGLVPLADIDLAVQETKRIADLGLVGVMVRPNYLYGRNLGDAAYDPLWSACVELGLTVSVHEGLGLHGSTIGTDRFTSFAPRHAMSHPMEQMAAMASFVLDGALERHPGLRVAFLESGTGWLPYWLARLDDHVEWMAGSETKELTCSASECFARQCVISSDPEDPLVARTIATVGADHVLWASDFPHPDAAFPDAVDEFLHHNPDVAAGDLDAVLWHTPVEFYGLGDRVATPR